MELVRVIQHGSISTTTTYYVDATDGGCTTATRTAVIATINTIPTITGYDPGLQVRNRRGSIRSDSQCRYDQLVCSIGRRSFTGTGTSYTTPSISATTTYYVDATNNGVYDSDRGLL